MQYATYNITDDKLRLSLGYTPDKEEIEAMRAAGFSYWPGSKLNVSKWCISAENYILNLGIEIEDDDTPDDVENRVDRFSGYANTAKRNADAASNAVHRIADNIPLGQPILVNHHSERHARADAKRIDNGMRRAIAEGERAAYWKGRISAAIAHAEYKERPDVITRRIKKIEAEKRGLERDLEKAQKFLKLWQDGSKELTLDRAMAIANYDNVQHFCFTLAEYPRNEHTYEGLQSIWSALKNGIIGPEKAKELACTGHERGIAGLQRCIDHVDKVLEYQRALLIAMGGAIGCKWEIEVGGKVRIGTRWYLVLRVNRKDGQIVSVTTDCQYVKVKGVEKIDEYEAPTAEQAATIKEKTKKAPLCNYPGEGFHQITQENWDRRSKDYKGTRDIPAGEKYLVHRVRFALMAGCKYEPVFITDAKTTYPPEVKA